ncbi:MAG: glycosyltransferase [Pseudomonadota bacterium]
MDTQNLRVLFIIDAIRGRNGVGTYYQDLVASLDNRHQRVELISPSPDQPHPCQGAALPMPGDPTQKLYLPRYGTLLTYILRFRPDVIVIPGPGLFSLAAFLIARRFNIPLCVTCQTDYNRLAELYWKPGMARLAGGLLNWLNYHLFRHASSVVAISEHMQDEARRGGVRHPHMVGTPLAAEFAYTPVSPLPTSLRSLLYVGRLAAEKNIGAFLDLAEQRPDMEFHVAGDGPMRDQVLAAQKRLPNLHFHGWCSRHQVVTLMDSCEVLMLPSHVEAFGTVALEAMARQRLVMTTPHCGINQWPELAAGLIQMKADETSGNALKRLEALAPWQRQNIACRARQAAINTHKQCAQNWQRVLGNTARAPIPHKRPSRLRRGMALLRRQSTSL